MENLAKPPRWIILSIIFMTAILSFVVLAKIWFPDLISNDVFVKIILTFIVIFLSSAAIAVTKKLLKTPSADTEEENK